MLRNKRDSVLPPARLYRAELEWLKTQANQRNISFSEYLRLRLLHPGKLRRVSTRRAEEREKQGQENAGYPPPGESASSDNRSSVSSEPRRCIHGHAVFGGRFVNCVACQIQGLRIEGWGEGPLRSG